MADWGRGEQELEWDLQAAPSHGKVEETTVATHQVNGVQSLGPVRAKVRDGSEAGSQANQGVEGSHHLRELCHGHPLGHNAPNQTTRAHHQGHLSEESWSCCHSAQSGEQAHRDSHHTKGVTQAGSLLRGQPPNASNTAQGRNQETQLMDLWSSSEDTTQVASHEDEGRDAVQVVELRTGIASRSVRAQ